ncbi:FAD-binding oxidoreductase [Nocardiopsis deserti]|uniref:FAD-binding oxidoreductase n=1 Tax=Nocardiopsis deserti TaxID=2605988 RepID=UPI001CC225ED|nr:FAD-binding protein [Nocardiopsis deserti]
MTPNDPLYDELVLRGYNRRAVGTPDYVYLVESADDVVVAVNDAVQNGKLLSVRSGGHCFETFVDDSDVRVIIDMSRMTGVTYDWRRRAFLVEAGATLGQIYTDLYGGWGVTLPGGWCPDVGAGGHIMGGGYGPLSRLHGLSSDYLQAVEVVVVNASGEAETVVVSREDSGSARDLWWAHTGGGGGNFGVVTRYWLRDPHVRARARASAQLPNPPESVLSFSVNWSWDGIDEAVFTRLMRNYMDWCEEHSAVGAAEAPLFSELYAYRRPSGVIPMLGQVNLGSGGEEMLADKVAAMGAGLSLSPIEVVDRVPWETVVQTGPPGGGDTTKYRAKIKAAYLRSGYTDAQLSTAFRYLTDPGYTNPLGALGFHAYGGRVNALAPSDTAHVQRDSVMKLSYLTAWQDPAEDAEHMRWMREFYRDVYASTGGVPVPNSANDGAYINYPDSDLADPAWNTSGAPWSELYYKGNYARLQRTKACWDPHDVFNHALSVRAD